MKRLITFISVVFIANIAMTSVISAEEKVNVKNFVVNKIKTEINEINSFLNATEYKREFSRDFSVGSSPSLTIKNSFGKINIVEGADDKIVFKITIIGKGKNDELAKNYAETADVNFSQNSNSIIAKTEYEKIKCKNCGRTVDYEVTVPKSIKLILENKYGDVIINNASEPIVVKVDFGKFFANVISDIDLSVTYGGATINKCENMKIKSGFSKFKLGEVGSITGKIEYDGYDIKELGKADISSGFSNMDVEKLKKSFSAKSFSYGSLVVKNVDFDFSDIKIDASFAKVRIALNENHNFKATLYTSFGNIKTGKVGFYEKTLDKKDAIVGVAGKIKEPSSTVNISNSYGNINFE